MTEKREVVIAGGGRVGLRTVELLDDQGHDCTVVERDGARCEALSDAFVATVIEGDATDPEVLEQAGLPAADVIAGLTGQTGTNLAVCLLARELAPEVRTVARIATEKGRHYGRFVDATVFPEQAGARVAANEIVGADVRTLADVTGDMEIMQIRVAENAPGAGKSLTEVRLPAGSLIVSDDAGNRIARPETTLTPGERYVVAVEPDVADEVLNLLRG